MMARGNTMGYAALAQMVCDKYNITILTPSGLGELLDLPGTKGQRAGAAARLLQEMSWTRDEISRGGRSVYRRNGQVKSFSSSARRFAERMLPKVISNIEKEGL